MLIKMDLRRAFTGSRFYISVAVALAILLRPLFDGVGPDSSFIYLQEFPFGFSDYTPFAALFCVFPFADSFCEDINSGYLNDIAARTGGKGYAFNRFISNALVGGITQGLIVAITLLYCFFRANMPDTPETVAFFQGTVWDELNLLLPFHSIGFLLMRVFLAVLFGGLWASVGLCVAAFSKNRYITLVVPFVIYQLLWRLTDNPLFSPLEGLVANGVSSLPLLILYQLTLILLCGVIAVKTIQKRIIL